MFEHVELLRVCAWGRDVGAITTSASSGRHVFEYASSWAGGSVELSPLITPNSRRMTRWPRSDQGRAFHGLPPFIADALPDRYGDEVMDAYLARLGMTRSSLTALDRLAYIGDRGMGALIFEPATALAEPGNPLTLAQLVSSSREVLAGSARSGPVSDILPVLLRISGSTGGAQAKALVHYRLVDAGVELHIDTRPAPMGFHSAILKMTTNTAGAIHQPGRVEAAYAELAAGAGVGVQSSRLVLDDDGVGHFLANRFDRTADGTALHMQTLAAMTGLDFNDPRGHDATVYLNAVKQLNLGPEALAQAYRRIVFNQAACVCDDHLKNFGFLCDSAGHWTLSPAYDLTFTPKTGPVHQMLVLGKDRNVTISDLLTVADIHGISDAQSTIDEVVEAVRRWPQFAAMAAVPASDSAQISKAFPAWTAQHVQT